jgi:hypothetical protein|tara:strand:+ start:979 stop:1236 length:258 start_codon:yes stop_codon:yes gene_type:complete
MNNKQHEELMAMFHEILNRLSVIEKQLVDDEALGEYINEQLDFSNKMATDVVKDSKSFDKVFIDTLYENVTKPKLRIVKNETAND